MAEDQNKNTVDDTTKTTEYEDVCIYAADRKVLQAR